MALDPYSAQTCCLCFMQMLHLHIRLLLLAHLFLEHNLYTGISGLTGHENAKNDQVLCEEAMSVAEFWYVVNPLESKLLVHLKFVRAVFCL